MDYRIRRPDLEQSSSETSHNEQWANRTLRDVLFEAYREQNRKRTWSNIWRGIFLLCFLLIFFGGQGKSNSEKNQSFQFSKSASKPHTAMINLSGEISSENDPVKVLQKGMQAAYENRNVRAIVIRANSPGGSPVISNIAFEEILRLKAQHQNIPVYAVAEDMCASGCYYIVSATDKIFADPSSLVGSIGVIGSSFDATELMNKLGIKRRVRIAGNNKGMGDPFTPETPEQQAIWQQMLEQIHTTFIGAVRKGRGNKINEAKYPDVFSGRVFTGIEAKKAGLIDDFGNVYSVARDVVEAPELVDYTPVNDDLMRLLNRHFGTKVEEKVNEISNKFW